MLLSKMPMILVMRLARMADDFMEYLGEMTRDMLHKAMSYIKAEKLSVDGDTIAVSVAANMPLVAEIFRLQEQVSDLQEQILEITTAISSPVNYSVH